MPIIANDKYYILKADGKYYDILNPFKTFTLTIVPTPLDATVTLTAQGYSQVGNSITVRRGTTVSWSVSKTNYFTQSGSQLVSADETKNITLQAEFTPATYRFDFTGAVQTLTIPSGCTKLIVDCVGGGAMSDPNLSSSVYYSYGGRVQCELSVTAGQTLQIYVGGTGWGSGLNSGTSPPNGVGYNGGGNGLYFYQNYWSGSCGGGASDIRTSADLNSRLVVAGGAGGLGGDSGGAGGGLIGGNGSDVGGYHATGGTQSSGGAGSGSSKWGTKPSGSFGYGGGGNGTPANGCLGGGGGWYGGGAGNLMSYPMTSITSGAGGSSYTHPTLCTNVVHTQGYSQAKGNGWIIITTSNE